MPTLDRDGDVLILHLGDDENRFNPDWVGAVGALLEEAAATEAPRALVLGASGKIWSNGLDLDWIGANLDQLDDFIPSVQELFASTLVFPGIVVAAIQGHCFAAGAMLALACDQRVMRADRGFFCLPEADINIPFTPGMSALVQAKLSPPVAHEAMTTGRRYGGADAAALQIVDEAVGEDEVLARAVERAAAHAAKSPDVLRTIKERMYPEVVTTLRAPASFALGS
jgi:enoyl-CoA hydratase/carnithine racemase